MDSKIKEIMNVMDTIQYGFKDKDDYNIINDVKKWDEEFYKFYYLQTPEELLQTKCGVCWDQVELERKLFHDKNIPIKTYFIYLIDNDDLPSHTFLAFKDKDKYYWFEHSWQTYKGVREYESEKALLEDVKEKFLNDHNYNLTKNIFYIYEYQKPVKHISCNDFYKYIETQKLVLTNDAAKKTT